MKAGTGAAYLRARLLRDAPEVLGRLEAGDFASVRAAAIAAGIVRVVIPGRPQPQGRARAVRTGAGVRVVDPARSRAWKRAARLHMQHAMRGRLPLAGPLTVRIEAVFPLPRSEYRVRAPVPRRWCDDRRGDADNIAKACLDAGNGVLWGDDAQVARLEVLRIVGAQGEAPRVALEVSVLEAAP